MNFKKVTHLTSVHPRYDTRIFFKECCSLVCSGYDVSLIVADGNNEEVKNDITIYDVGTSPGRMHRITHIPDKIFTWAQSLDTDIYHLHDPELIPIGLKLKRLGKKVIFDSHEDIPQQMLSKPYWNKPARWLIAQLLALYEKWACKHFDAVVTATPFIRDKFLSINPCSIDINNYPVLDELISSTVDWSNRKEQICYVGVISSQRGIKEMVQAMEFMPNSIRLKLAGAFGSNNLEKEVQKYLGWAQVDDLGWLHRDAVRKLLARSISGLVTFHPLPNHIDAQPNKMFEYMSAGIPVIASYFPSWKKIIKENNCGLCVDPLDPKDIARAMMVLITNPNRAAEMGVNGQKAVKKLYNWKNEEKKLLDLYQALR